jgi:hypothetical protein
MRGWLWGRRRVELPQRRAQRIEPLGVGKPVVFDASMVRRIALLPRQARRR